MEEMGGLRRQAVADNSSIVMERWAEDNRARDGGGAIFFVNNSRTGTLLIAHSRLTDNPSLGFETTGSPGIFYLGRGRHPQVRHSTSASDLRHTVDRDSPLFQAPCVVRRALSVRPAGSCCKTGNAGLACR